MGKSLDELRVEAAALQGASPESSHKKTSIKSVPPKLEEWEKQIVEINRAKKSKPHPWHNRIVECINAGDEVAKIMERFKVSTNTIKSVMKIHNQADMNNDKTI